MRKELRIKKNEDFQKVFKQGKSFANRQFVIYVLDKENQQYYRVGLSVSKKLGNAVVRNKIKRYIRRGIHEMNDKILIEKDYIIIARSPAVEMEFEQFKKSLQHVFSVAKVLKK